jgi:dienelactone hydrolase
MIWGVLALACSSGPTVAPADPARVGQAAGLGVISRAPLSPVEGRASRGDGYWIRPVSLQVYEGLRVSAALFLPVGEGPHPGVLVAVGHFGEGKTAGESQGPAHALASLGYAVLVVDTPGVEEGDLPGRRIHLAEGAHGRALLAAAGTSAMAVQLESLQAGLDYLSGRPDVGAVAASGASGGAVQALYLSFIDPRVKAVVLASYVPMPREERAGGCACDQLPGWPGPDPALHAAVSVPSLWLTELEQPRPAGLPRGADFAVVAGPHSYSPEMIQRAADWLAGELGHAQGTIPAPLPHSPGSLLASRSVGDASWADLVAGLDVPLWKPAPWRDVAWLGRCQGEGPAVVLGGAGPEDLAAVMAAGLSACPITVEDDEAGLGVAIVNRKPYADRYAGALRAAAEQHEAVGVYAVRGWGTAALGAGLPYVLRDPLTLSTVDPARDPAWVHAPGVWWTPDVWGGAVATGTDPAMLAAALVPGP